MTGRVRGVSFNADDQWHAGLQQGMLALAQRARQVDGHPPFNDQMLVDLRNGAADSVIVADPSGQTIGAAAARGSLFELVVDPAQRSNGIGTRLGRASLRRLLDQGERVAQTWAHGTLEPAQRLASALHMERSREIHVMVLDPRPHTPAHPNATDVLIRESTLTAEQMARLNHAAFSTDPDQGSLTTDDIRARMREPWFHPQGLLVASSRAGLPVGYCWVKAEPDSTEGEIYALGLVPEARGKGIGRALLDAGIDALRAQGRTHIILYVDGANAAAIMLYQRRGFHVSSTDTQYTIRSARIEP